MYFCHIQTAACVQCVIVSDRSHTSTHPPDKYRQNASHALANTKEKNVYMCPISVASVGRRRDVRGISINDKFRANRPRRARVFGKAYL